MIPLFKTSQVRKADSYAINKLGIPGIVLMENASLNIFNSILSGYPELDPTHMIGIICGKGNNGGDGFAVARHFINHGFKVKIISLAKKTELKGDALVNYKITEKLIDSHPESRLITYKSLQDLNMFKDCIVILDAILGTGTKGELEDPLKSIIKRLNGFNSIKVAVDTPSGLDLETAYGETIFNADLTVTLAEFKSGLFYGKGYSHAGTVLKGNIGIDPTLFDEFNIDEYLIEPEDAFVRLPEKEIDSHKYSAGKVLTIAGSGHLPGASFFTTNAVLKVGAGASILAFPKSLKQTAQQKLDASIVFPYDDDGSEYLRVSNIGELHDRLTWADVVAIGPGLGREKETVQAIRKILAGLSNKKMVIDADAVFALGNNFFNKVNLKNKILTPHHKEFADLLGISIENLHKSLLKIGRTFASDTGAFLVLKGAPTIVFNPKGEVFINSSGNEGMAKFGTGDVLTGVIAGILSQTESIEDAVISSVYLHSLSADLLLESKTEYGITASDLLENLPSTLKFLRDSFVSNP